MTVQNVVFILGKNQMCFRQELKLNQIMNETHADLSNSLQVLPFNCLNPFNENLEHRNI